MGCGVVECSKVCRLHASFLELILEILLIKPEFRRHEAMIEFNHKIRKAWNGEILSSLA